MAFWDKIGAYILAEDYAQHQFVETLQTISLTTIKSKNKNVDLNSLTLSH